VDQPPDLVGILHGSDLHNKNAVLSTLFRARCLSRPRGAPAPSCAYHRDQGPAMQLWWSTIISSPSRTSVPVTISEPQRHHGADKGTAQRAAARPRAQLQPAVPISVCPLVA